MPLFTPVQLQKLLNAEYISNQHPWSTNDSAIQKFYAQICSEITNNARVKSLIEWDDYGSGYASYFDAWFYNDTAEFENSTLINVKAYNGLAVLFSRLSHYFVFLEGSKSWSEKSRGSYMPAFDSIDALRTSAVIALANEVQPILENHGLKRLSREDLSTVLPEQLEIRTLFGNPPYREYDALFNWED